MPHGPRYARVNHGPLSWLRPNEQFTSDDSDALPHAEQAEAVMLHERLESSSTVLHSEPHRTRHVT